MDQSEKANGASNGTTANGTEAEPDDSDDDKEDDGAAVDVGVPGGRPPTTIRIGIIGLKLYSRKKEEKEKAKEEEGCWRCPQGPKRPAPSTALQPLSKRPVSRG